MSDHAYGPSDTEEVVPFSAGVIVSDHCRRLVFKQVLQAQEDF